MHIILSNLRAMFKTNAHFAIMIAVTIMTGCFAVCFSIGVLDNNKNKALEDAINTNKMFVVFKGGVNYQENFKVFDELLNIFGDDVVELEMFYEENDVESGDGYMMCTYSDKDYKPGNTLKKLSYQLIEGRTLSSEDYDNARRVALVREYQEKSISLGENVYDVVGIGDSREYSLGIPTITVPITSWGNNPVSNYTINLNRIPTVDEYDKFKNLLEENFPGKYKIPEYCGVDSDIMALYRTVGVAVTGIMSIIMITILFLMGYIYENRRYRMAVYRLNGCSCKRAVGYLMGEAAIITIPSSALGVVVFMLLRILYFDRYYHYMRFLFDAKLCMLIVLLVSALILIEIAVMSLRLASRSLKREMVEVRG